MNDDIAASTFSDDNELFTCEVCSNGNNKPMGSSLKVPPTDENAMFCPRGHVLFPKTCDNCKESWQGFVRDRNRILCLHCDYPVHVFLGDAQPLQTEEKDVKLFDKAPGFLICTCCQSFEIDLFMLLPIDETHLYFRCSNCLLEMILEAKESFLDSAIEFLGDQSCSAVTASDNLLADATFLTSRIPQKLFNEMMVVAESRLCNLQDQLNDPRTTANERNARNFQRRPKTLKKVIDKLLQDQKVRGVAQQILGKVPAMGSDLIGVLVTALTKDPEKGAAAGLIGGAVLKPLCELISADLENRAMRAAQQQRSIKY